MNSNEKTLMIIGASGHGKVVADTARCIGYQNICFLDDNPDVTECLGYPVVGRTKDAMQFPESQFVVAIGNPKVREKVQKQILEWGLDVATLIHPQAVIAQQVEIGQGTVVMAGAVINANTVLGEGCIVNTCASVDHANRLADYVRVSVGSHLAGTVTVGKATWIGIGAIISNNLTIGEDCMIGAGAVVVTDLQAEGTYVGIPARWIK